MSRAVTVLRSAVERTQELRQRAFDAFLDFDCAETTVAGLVRALDQFGTTTDQRALLSGRQLLDEVADLTQSWIDVIDTFGGSTEAESDDLSVVQDAGHKFYAVASNLKSLTRRLDEYATTHAEAARAAHQRCQAVQTQLTRIVGAARALLTRVNDPAAASTPDLQQRALQLEQGATRLTLDTPVAQLQALEASITATTLTADSYARAQAALQGQVRTLLSRTQSVLDQLPEAGQTASRLLQRYPLDASEDLHPQLRRVRSQAADVIAFCEAAFATAREGLWDQVESNLKAAEDVVVVAEAAVSATLERESALASLPQQLPKQVATLTHRLRDVQLMALVHQQVERYAPTLDAFVPRLDRVRRQVGAERYAWSVQLECTDLAHGLDAVVDALRAQAERG